MAQSCRGISVFVPGPKKWLFSRGQTVCYCKALHFTKGSKPLTVILRVPVPVVYTESGRGDKSRPSLGVKCLIWNVLGTQCRL